MKRIPNFLLALILISSSSCKISPVTNSTATTQSPSVTSSTAVIVPPNHSTVVEGALKIITLKCDSTCRANEIADLPKIEAHMNATLSGNCFAAYVLAPGRRIDDNLGLLPAQILAKLLEPSTLTLSYFTKYLTKEEGYEDASDFTIIHFNRVKTNNMSICDRASLGAHEFSHTKKFFHIGNAAPPNYYTVPYLVNHGFDGKSFDAYNGGCCNE